jgi:hypothetical protein
MEAVTMIITKKYLQQIIKEEISRLLEDETDCPPGFGPRPTTLTQRWNSDGTMDLVDTGEPQGYECVATAKWKFHDSEYADDSCLEAGGAPSWCHQQRTSEEDPEITARRAQAFDHDDFKPAFKNAAGEITGAAGKYAHIEWNDVLNWQYRDCEEPCKADPRGDTWQFTKGDRDSISAEESARRAKEGRTAARKASTPLYKFRRDLGRWPLKNELEFRRKFGYWHYELPKAGL